MAEDEIRFKITGDTEQVKGAFKGLGSVVKATGAAMAAAVAAAGAAAVKLGQEIVSSYADYEQLVGGVDTLFKNSSETVQQYAANAYKTAGMSANEYMETVTGFSASLISSLGGDTKKAAEYADMAVTDMADNANKMGTDIESIQNAYQGFAKSNYTMLDNLKLGYGGTKEEMERLLEDAEAISGIEYNIDSYADVVAAIHTIQESMGIAGTTKEEAEHTITGSIDTLKGAISNLVTGFGNAEADIAQLCQNVAESFNNVVTNITPVIQNIVAALPTAVDALLEAIAGILPTLLDAVIDLFSRMLNTLLSMLPDMIPAVVNAVVTIANTLIDNLPLLLDAAAQLMIEFISGINDALPQLIPSAVNAVTTIADTLTENWRLLMDAATQLINGLADGIVNNLPVLAPVAVQVITDLATGLTDHAGDLLGAAIEIIGALAASLIASIPDLLYVPVEICDSIADSLVHYDWSAAANIMMNNLADALDGAQKQVQVWLDNMFTNGELYGGNVNNVDTTDFINYMRDGADIVTDNIKETTDAIAACYDEGKGKVEQAQDNLTETTGSDAMARYYEQQGKAAEKAAEEVAKSTKKTVETVSETVNTVSEIENKISDEFKAAYEDLNMQLVYGEITEEDYYNKLGKLLEKYHAKGLSAYNKYYSEINSYRDKQNKAALKQLTQSQKESISALKSSLNELAKTYQSKYNEIVKEQEAYSKKLKSGLDIFQKEETDDKIIYSISNIKEYKKQVDEFTKSIQKLKDRNLNTDLLNEIMNMDMADGLVYSKNLLAMGDKEFNEINDTYNEVSKLIDDRSQELYSGELQKVNDDFVSDVRELFGGLPEEIKGIGLESAAGFVDGLDTSKETVIGDITDYFDGIFDSIGDSIDSASAGVINADDYVDAFTKELDDRRSEIYAAVSKLLENADAAAVIKTTVETESSAAPAAVSGGVKTLQTASESKSGKTDKTDESKNQPLYLTLDGKIIAEYVINYANNKSRVTGGSVIK